MEEAVNLIFARDLKGIAELVKQGKYEVNSFISIDRSGLALAAACGYLGVMECLIEHGADVNLNNAGDLGYTPIESAARDGKLAAVKLLLKHGAEIDKGNTIASNALIGACISAHKDVIEYLLLQGANVDHTDNQGQTALHYLCRSAKQWGSSKITQTVNGVTTELENPQFQKHSEIFNILIVAGADVNLLTAYGYTPLHLAAETGTTSFIMPLILMGAKVNAQNSKGFSPLHAAADRGQVKACQALIEKGADVNLIDSDGFTPLLGAVSAQNIELVKFFLANGAKKDSKAKINYGKVAIGDDVVSLANKLGNEELISVVISSL